MRRDACREVLDTLALGSSDESMSLRARAHVGRCAACRANVADQARLVDALKSASADIDDVTRARWLARLAPAIDDMASRYAAPPPARRPRWLLAAPALAAIVVVWASAGRDELSAPVAPSVTPPPIVRPEPSTAVDTALLRPYIVTDPSSEETATSLLASRTSVLEMTAGTVRASIDGGDERIAVIGPGRVSVAGVSPDQIELRVDAGTLLVDAGSPRRTRLSAGAIVIVAQSARFAVEVSENTTLVFVERGEIEVDGETVLAGQWRGATSRGAAALAAVLRDHESLIPPARTIVERHGSGTTGPAARASGRVPDPRMPELPDAEPVSESSAAMYARAETALADGDRADAEAIWKDLVARHPGSPQAASALYELAALARARDDASTAASLLDRLLEGPPPRRALHELALYLRCRIHVEAGEVRAATRCFGGFRTAFPDSAHDSAVLAWLAATAETAADCTTARPLAGEYLRKYARDGFVARARQIVGTCHEAP